MKTKISRIIVILFSTTLVIMFACSKKLTKSRIEYREPISFDIFKQYEGQELPKEYMDFCKATWDSALKNDKEVKENTWLKGDYTVFVYNHPYSFWTDKSYAELIIITSTVPIGKKKWVYVTVTPFIFEYDSVYQATKIGTYVFTDSYNPIDSEKIAIQLMISYLDEYITKYNDDYLLGMIKYYLEYWHYTWEYTHHYCFYQAPGDFGGSIIVNKLTSKLEFLGSSVFMGHGKRYFPPITD